MCLLYSARIVESRPPRTVVGGLCDDENVGAGPHRRPGPRWWSHNGDNYRTLKRGPIAPREWGGPAGVHHDPDLFVYVHPEQPGTLPPSCVDAGDSNDDGSLDVSDGIYSLAALFILGSPPPPEPHSACGPDVTADEITCQAFNCP